MKYAWQLQYRNLLILLSSLITLILVLLYQLCTTDCFAHDQRACLHHILSVFMNHNLCNIMHDSNLV
jgi:hypothetical protein